MIYIIDDDQHVLRGFGMLLMSAGYEFKTYSNAGDFLKECTPSISDLLILDYHLPGMNGCELLEYLKLRKIYVPTIIVTAFEDKHSRDCAKNYGAIAYLRKPVDGEALIDLIKYSSQTPD